MIGLKINRRIWLKLSSDTKYKCKLTSHSVCFIFFFFSAIVVVLPALSNFPNRW